ncbi:hypothetical protein GCM10010123_08370 [Pilimelia anulata]|uniref:DUF4360 domain-containing protein n=1 Tax=Pilimelia anulata TaxID=53371 RepID=A0A8J3B7M1_9ACTN|nr:DUF4360 domain-containing protein [Pilimelia anulata]GGJ80791.1 hypothetical protein GCM10010123_08370 [Pilimelia anulata]
MRLATRIAAAALAGLAAVPGGPAAAGPPDDPATDPVRVRLVTVAGSGCPRGSAYVAPQPDDAGITVSFGGFRAATPPDPDLKACTLVLEVTPPAGYRARIGEVTYRGDARLTGGHVTFKAKYQWAGGDTVVHPGWSRRGWFNDRWQVTQHPDRGQWSDCGTDRLNLTQSLRADGAGVNRIGMTRPDEDWALRIDWRLDSCNRPDGGDR